MQNPRRVGSLTLEGNSLRALAGRSKSKGDVPREPGRTGYQGSDMAT